MDANKFIWLAERDALAGKPKEACYDIPNIDHSDEEVGQKIRISCGHFKCWAEVVTVAPVEVRMNEGGLLRFDSEGKGYYIEETFDCPGPWYLAFGGAQ